LDFQTTTSAKKTQTVCTVSDLHLFCRRSHADKHLDALHAAAGESDRFVLNGDIFDFRWSVYPTIPETVKRAIEWLDEFTARHSHCQFHYVLGNHDSVRPFIDALDAFAAARPNLAWDPYYVRLGTSVFLHGDVAHRRMSAHDLARQRSQCALHRRRGEVWNRVWDAAFDAGVQKAVVRMASPTRRVVERVHHYLDAVGHGPATGTRRVYFGHTHTPIQGYVHRGVAYYNGGSPLRGLRFDVLKARIDV
jgi:UDP-2,3-diacylglucosamine hydrolase